MQHEFFKPFGIPEDGGIVQIPAAFKEAGYLELQVLSGGPVFGFRGAVTKESAQDKTSWSKHPENVDFDIGAAVGQRAIIKLERGIGELTLYADSSSVGFLRFVGDCQCRAKS